MIKFSLACEKEHEFEIWFSSNDDFVSQKSKSLIACPFCHSTKVDKTLMSPAITNITSADESTNTVLVAPDDKQRKIIEKMRKLRKELLSDAKDVGDKFPEEARKIHYGESEEKGIYGQAGPQEIEELWDEGIPVAPLPDLPEDAN